MEVFSLEENRFTQCVNLTDLLIARITGRQEMIKLKNLFCRQCIWLNMLLLTKVCKQPMREETVLNDCFVEHVKV